MAVFGTQKWSNWSSLKICVAENLQISTLWTKNLKKGARTPISRDFFSFRNFYVKFNLSFHFQKSSDFMDCKILAWTSSCSHDGMARYLLSTELLGYYRAVVAIDDSGLIVFT